MITDALLLLSSAQAVTSTAVSTNTIDLSQARDIGAGETLFAVFTVDTTFTAAGAATMQLQIITSAAANLGTPTVIGQTDALGKAEFAAGRKPISIAIPRAQLAAQPIGQRYLGVQYTVATGPMTAGAITCNIVHDTQDIQKTYPSGFSVS
jgi:hypothetical protein